jgi:ferredoxin
LLLNFDKARVNIDLMKVLIDAKKCVLCGACEVLTDGAIISSGNQPAYLNPKANLKDKIVQEKMRTAAETCPQKAIKIIE